MTANTSNETVSEQSGVGSTLRLNSVKVVVSVCVSVISSSFPVPVIYSCGAAVTVNTELVVDVMVAVIVWQHT